MSSTADAPARAGGGAFTQIDAAIAEAVRSVAAAEPDPTDPFRGLYISDASAVETSLQIDGSPADGRVEAVSARLGLDDVESAILAVCAAPELDPRYARLIAYLHDDVTRRWASTRLIGRLLAPAGVDAGAVLRRLAAEAPLRRDGIVRMLDAEPPVPAADRGLCLDDLVVAELLGCVLVRPGRSPGVRLAPRSDSGVGRDELVARLARVLPPPAPALVACIGADAEQVVARAWRRDLVVIDAAAVADADRAARARLQARLAEGAVVVEGASALEPGAVAAFQAGLRAAPDLRVLIDVADVRRVLPPDQTLHQIEVPALTVPERRAAWSSHLPDAPVAEVADRFALSAAQIGQAAAAVRLRVRERGTAGAGPQSDDLLATGRSVSHGLMAELATRLEAGPGWDDLVLPEEDLALLRSIAAFVRHRDRVLNEWGFARHPGGASGLTALFAGESGTGKTLAARVIAADLGLEAYRIDLAGVVSKYIGETEKNLERIFDAAAGGNAVLIFDEADALFGKRSAVSDARDRYANLEVAYLLQRLERHDGAVILTTNLRHNIDQAFLRRLDFTVDFPLPGVEQRLDLWRRHLPPEAPTGDLDLDRLAAMHQVAGGSIASCARLAAFAAAEAGSSITMEHLERAAGLELRKLGRLA